MGKCLFALSAVRYLTSSCSPAANQSAARTALEVADLSSTFAPEHREVQAVLDACRIEQGLAPVVAELISQREAEKCAGVRWQLSGGDAGRP